VWITVLTNRKYGAKWLPYYLDLKHVTRNNATGGRNRCYRLLLFARESPQRVNNVTSLPSILPNANHCKSGLCSAKRWFHLPAQSKNLLKRSLKNQDPRFWWSLRNLSWFQTISSSVELGFWKPDKKPNTVQFRGESQNGILVFSTLKVR